MKWVKIISNRAYHKKGENMARKPPTSSTVKKLFALSGNACTCPGCSNKLIEDNVILGEICHIEAAEENGPRYNKGSDDDYRRSFENLLLLCEKCHKKIDSDLIAYPTTLLLEWKKQQNIKKQITGNLVNDEIVDKLIEKFMIQSYQNTGSGSQINNQTTSQVIGTQIGVQNIFHRSNDKAAEQTTIEGIRKVIPEFKKLIDEVRENAKPPKKAVIDFRNDLNEGTERNIELVPIRLLKFRKDNGRIRAEIESHEKTAGHELVEQEDETQKLIRKILKELNPEDNKELKRLLKHKGQTEPAIITCDGFLINGNRRKLALEELFQENGEDPKFESMRVVILPEKVTEIDIQKIENRYQLQSEGKSEYHGLNRALTFRKNIEKKFSLKAQLKDDPNYVDLEGKDFERAVEKIQKEFLNPLDCVDRYLETFNRKGLYNTISEKAGDKEGRWQAFIDYSAFYDSVLNNAVKRRELGVLDNEVGLIENAIFKIIRKRSLNSKELERSLGKVHAFVRSSNLKKYLENPVSKQKLIGIAKVVKEDVSSEEKISKDGKRYTEREVDELWGAKFEDAILGNLMQAYKAVHKQVEREKPIDLLGDALKKLNHENLKIVNMAEENYKDALFLCNKIIEKANEIFSEIDHARGNRKKGK